MLWRIRDFWDTLCDVGETLWEARKMDWGFKDLLIDVSRSCNSEDGLRAHRPSQETVIMVWLSLVIVSFGYGIADAAVTCAVGGETVSAFPSILTVFSGGAAIIALTRILQLLKLRSPIADIIFTAGYVGFCHFCWQLIATAWTGPIDDFWTVFSGFVSAVIIFCGDNDVS